MYDGIEHNIATNGRLITVFAFILNLQISKTGLILAVLSVATAWFGEITLLLFGDNKLSKFMFVCCVTATVWSYVCWLGGV